ncbi:unnamed protein product [Amoebophrya sp. A120]|nr:unnamed protein product [Amoebophrya sp. A120]|eukprot:GSA120T00014131001.1
MAKKKSYGRSHPHGRAATMPTTPSQRWKPPCRTPTLRKHITYLCNDVQDQEQREAI